MPVISPNAFAPPVANDRGNPVPPTLREQVRRLERAHSAQRAGRTAVPLGLPEIDAAAARRRPADRRPARDRGGAGAVRPGRRPRRRGAGLHRLPDGPAGPRHPAVVPPALGRLRRTALCAGAGRLVRPGAAADGHGAARRGSVLGDGGRAAHARYRRRCRARPRRRSHRRPPPVARRREERRARPAAARPAGAAAKRLRDALAGRLGALARARSRPLAGRAAAQPLRQALGRRDAILAPGVER